MDTTMLERIHTYLIDKRSSLSKWLNANDREKKTILLGPSNQEAVMAHLEIIEEDIVKSEAGGIGVCRVCGDGVDNELLEIDYTADVCLDHLSAEETTRLEDELELAKAVQKALLPQETPAYPGMEIAAYSRPAQFLGGDYFDFINFNTDSHGLVIADVAGHGVSASLQMASIQTLARAIVPSSHSPAEVVERIHGLFKHNLRFTTFVTVFIGAFNPATRTLTYCNAGHNPPLVLHRDGSQGASVSWLRPTGPALGLIEGATFGESTMTMNPGELLVMYTDGLVEAVNPMNEFFGTEPLVDVVERLHNSPAKEVVRGIRQRLEEFAAGTALKDDITLVVCSIS